MVINLTKPTLLDINYFLILKIKKLVIKYKQILDVKKIYFETPISGVIFIDIFPHFTEKKWITYESLTNKELMNVFRVLDTKSIYGLIDNKIRIKPKK